MSTRTDLAKEREEAAKGQSDRLVGMSDAVSRADVDDYRVQVSVERLRALREENHFTPNLRLLFSPHTSVQMEDRGDMS
jgi:hypothetical protein